MNPVNIASIHCGEGLCKVLEGQMKRADELSKSQRYGVSNVVRASTQEAPGRDFKISVKNNRRVSRREVTWA